MKRAEKILLICLLTTFIAGTAAGCGSMKSDVISYVDATIDLFVKGKTEEYMNITKSTEEEALKIYNDFIDIWANLFIVHEISEESREAFRELFREVFAEAKYKVKSTEKVEGEHKYIVIIEVEQITGLFEGLKKEVGMKLSDWEYAQPERPDDEEYNKAGYEVLYECLKSR